MNIFERIRASERLQTPVLDESQISALQTISTLQAHVGRWRSLRKRVAGQGLLATMLTVASLTLLVKFVAAGKEAFVARQLGVGDALDAFLVAYILPALAMSIIAGSFNSALIPTYVQVREREGGPAAQRLFSGVMFWSVGLLLLASVLLALLFPLVLPFLASGFPAGKLAFTRLLFWALLPIITLTGLATTWTAVLNAEGEFALPATTPIVTSLVVALILFFRVHTWGVWSLAVGTLAGACLEVALIGGCLRRRGVFLLPQWRPIDADLRQVMRQYAPLAAAALVFSGTGLADQAVAARLGPGSVAALNYGNKLVSLVLGVSAAAVSTVVLPHFSRLVALGDWGRLRGDLKSYTLMILLALIPLALLLAYFSVPLVRIVFERGAFTARDTRLVGQVQACFVMQIPFYTLGILCVRLISALKNNSRIFLLSLGSVVLNFVLDIVLAEHFGVAGIALSTSAVSVVSCGALYLFLIHMMPTLATTLEAQNGDGGAGEHTAFHHARAQRNNNAHYSE